MIDGPLHIQLLDRSCQCQRETKMRVQEEMPRIVQTRWMSNQISEFNNNVRHIMQCLLLMNTVHSGMQSIDRYLHESRGSMIGNWIDRRMKSKSVFLELDKGSSWNVNEEGLWSSGSVQWTTPLNTSNDQTKKKSTDSDDNHCDWEIDR